MRYDILIKSLSEKNKEENMALSYKPLWHLLIEKDMKKGDLVETAGITHNVVEIVPDKQELANKIF